LNAPTDSNPTQTIEEAMMTRTNTTTADREAFDALVSGEYENFCLFSCFVNGKPASAICAIDEDGCDEGEMNVTPLFVTVTDDMIITDHEGRGNLSS
jgi:hypothetical protein